MTKNYIIAHDLGTTGNKATLYDAEGHLRGSAFHGYDTEYANTGWAEQNVEDWWQAVCDSSRKLLHESHVRPDDIACIVFSGQMMGCVALDQNAQPLYKAIIWADQRALDQQRWLGERISADEVYHITGHRLSASYSLCKALWLRDNKPDIYRAAHKFVHAKDAIVARLTGIFATEPSDASGMNLYDLERRIWSEPILKAADFDPARLPDLRTSTDIVGTVLASVADEVGVAANTPVILGGGDGLCAAAGAGVVREGTAFNYIGSSSWIALATRQPVYDPEYRTFTWAHIVPGMFSPNGTMQTAGGSYAWLRNQFCIPEMQAAQVLNINPYELMNAQAEQSPPGARGLLFLPYLLGERSPRWNPQARGAFIGLDIRHTRADIIRAVLEGITMNLRIIQNALTAQGALIEAIRVIGGGARGRVWNQIMADIYGVPVHRLAILEEASSMGAALAGGVGTGLYPDFSMIESMNETVAVFEPEPKAQAAYEEILPVFDAAYQALLPVYRLMAK